MENLSDYDLLIFHAVDNLYDSFADRLKDFTNEGKSLLYIPTVDGDRSAYNQFWNKNLNFPKWITTARGSEENYLKIKDINSAHGIFTDIWQDKKAFQSSSRFYAIPVFQGNNEFKNLMTYSNNQPMLMEQNNKMLLASFLESETSDFRLSGFFPILMQQMVQYLTNSSGLTEKFVVGDTLTFRDFSMEKIERLHNANTGQSNFHDGF